MKQITRQPLIDEMVTFLEKLQPDAIGKIRTDNPEYADILKIGAILGVSDNNNEELKVRASVCFATTEVVIEKCDEELSNLKVKIKGTHKLQLYGQILTTISGASVVTSLATNHHEITYIAGTLSLFGALVPLIVDSLNKGLDKKKQLDDIYLELINLRLEAERNTKELNFFINNNFNIAGISEIINRCNQLCSDISEKLLLSS